MGAFGKIFGRGENAGFLQDFRGSSEYKRDMAVVFTRRALERVLGAQA